MVYVDNGSLRTFQSDIDPQELIWHRDLQDRSITVLEGDGWLFQFDDRLPFELLVGDTVFIPKMTYHRIHKGQNSLTINIVELT